jgi:hypothetical protein
LKHIECRVRIRAQFGGDSVGIEGGGGCINFEHKTLSCLTYHATLFSKNVKSKGITSLKITDIVAKLRWLNVRVFDIQPEGI